MDKEEEKKYRAWGFRLVQDGSNDMVVEYVSSITTVYFLLWLGPSGGFAFAEPGESISTSQVLAVSTFQLAPEIILDLYCTFMEVFGGLPKLHMQYWTVLREQKWSMSSFVRAFIGKVHVAVFSTGIVIMTSTK